MLTMQRYVQAQLERQKTLVQSMADVVRSAPGVPERGAPDGADEVSISIFNMLEEEGGMENAGFEPATSALQGRRSPN